MDSLADLIRQGIEAANEDLRKENDIRLQNEVPQQPTQLSINSGSDSPAAYHGITVQLVFPS